jgi:O-antigen/teichoic acid export membrane protein
MLLAVAPLMIFAMISAPYLLKCWLNRYETEIVYTLVVLAAAFLFRTVNNCTTGVLQGLNAVRIQRIYSIVSLFLNVSLSIIFIKYMGFKGAALGTFIAIMLSEMFYLWFFHHSYGQSVFVYLKYVYGKILPAALGAGLVTGFLLLVIPPPLQNLGRGMCFFLLCVSLILYAVLYVILLMRFRSLNIIEIGGLIGKFGGFFGRGVGGFFRIGR